MRSVALARALILLSALLVLSQLGCAKAPPTLTPAAQQAFYKTRVIKGLDLLRDFAIDGEATTPKVVSTATARQIVLYHQATLKIIQATDHGWIVAVSAGLEELRLQLSEADRQKVGPYIGLVRAILAEVQS